MNLNELAKKYLNLYELAKNQLDASHSRKNTRKYLAVKNPLTKEQMKAAVEFWKPYARIDGLYQGFYLKKTDLFAPEILPHDLYYTRIDPYFNPASMGRVLDNKCLYSRLFPGIPQPETVISRMGGHYYDAQGNHVPKAKALELLDAEPAVFAKVATTSCGGKGVFFLDSREGAISRLFTQEIKHEKDLIVQRPVRQHAAFAALNESSVNTLRILSVLSQDGVKIYSSVLRMGVDGSHVDNASGGGVTCGVQEDGKLRKHAYQVNGTRFDNHPASGIAFDGYQLPGVAEAKKLVEKAHPLMPHFRMISWDIAIQEDGSPIMIEANLSKGGLSSHQLNNGPLFGEDTKKILDEVFGKNK